MCHSISRLVFWSFLVKQSHQLSKLAEIPRLLAAENDAVVCTRFWHVLLLTTNLIFKLGLGKCLRILLQVLRRLCVRAKLLLGERNAPHWWVPHVGEGMPQGDWRT